MSKLHSQRRLLSPREYLIGGVALLAGGAIAMAVMLARSRDAGTAAGGTAGSMTAASEEAGAGGRAPPLTVWSVAHPDHFQQQKYEVTLKGDEELEYKAVLNRGDSLLYSWRVREGSPVYFEFHGEPTEGTWPKDYYESYEKGEGTSGQGSLVAPFTGRHGWYFLNPGNQPVTVDVELAGYFSDFSRLGAKPNVALAGAP